MIGMTRNWLRIRAGLLGLCAALALTGCSTTHKTRKVKVSGFLGDYSLLREGEEDEAQLVYINPRTDFSVYDKAMIDPVTIWRRESPELKDVNDKDLGKLATYLQTWLTAELKQDYALAHHPGPGVMRVRVAITEAEGSTVALDVVSNVAPPMIVISSAKRLATGTHAFVGQAGIEGEILDSVSGERLMAAVDRRAGRKVLRGKFGTWNDVKEAYQYWTRRLRTRLTELRQK